MKDATNANAMQNPSKTFWEWHDKITHKEIRNEIDRASAVNMVKS